MEVLYDATAPTTIELASAMTGHIVAALRTRGGGAKNRTVSSVRFKKYRRGDVDGSGQRIVAFFDVSGGLSAQDNLTDLNALIDDASS